LLANQVLEVQPVGTVHLFDEGDSTLELMTMQGGAFSDDGLLYLINGDDSTDCEECGIHVFEVSLIGSGEKCSSGPGDCEAHRIDRSRNSEALFEYRYNPGFRTYEEPEGITYWDLEADGAPSTPGITTGGQAVASSQLHALMLDNDWPSDDDIYVKHYRANVRCERIQYAAKIICGTQSNRNDGRLARGSYVTSINIHNPHDTTVSLSKSLALAVPPGAQRPGEVLFITEDSLQTNQALAVDCVDLQRRLFPGGLPGPFIEGFVVLESNSTLDVTAVYTVNHLDAQGEPTTGTSVDVERIHPSSLAWR
jgi:hypothetical protein